MYVKLPNMRLALHALFREAVFHRETLSLLVQRPREACLEKVISLDLSQRLSLRSNTHFLMS